MAQYTQEDISDLKENLINYQGINFVGEVNAEVGELIKYWQPTIGIYKGFEQIDISSNPFDAYHKASKLLWDKIEYCCEGDVDLLVSVNNYKNWFNIKVTSRVNIVDAFELYENEPEFVAIDKTRSFLVATHIEYPSEFEEQLWLYFFKIRNNENGEIIFIEGDKECCYC